jgi:murein DD-endopeptidase MepM/ murein hydrolase activator NlpD
VVTRYCHSAGIEGRIDEGTEVKQGQRIGSVGNSGTAAGVPRNPEYAHFHFEIRIGEHYLGKHMSLTQTRASLVQVVAPGI